jgi:hypothetical protein
MSIHSYRAYISIYKKQDKKNASVGSISENLRNEILKTT